MPANVSAALAIIGKHCRHEAAKITSKDSQTETNDVPAWESLPDLPTADELLEKASSDDLPFFPLKHTWDNKQDYLRSLYHILRFEGVEGLRYSVQAVRDCPNMTDDDNTCIYTKVRVQGYLFAKLGPIARVSISTQRAGARIKWKQSKRLQPGKIVALSSDFFKSDCRVAVIAQRPIEGGLDQNPPVIDLIWALPTQALTDPDQDLVMVESRNGYYEAVRHALKGLQQAAHEWSPLDKYLVTLDKNDLPYPTLKQHINYSSLVDHLTPDQLHPDDKHAEQQAFRQVEDQFRQMSRNSPSNLAALQPYTTLDDSQLQALERIITKEVAIIQGPPGTGKTFTSVKSITAILKNRQPGDPPVIVSAQTNHALDQLLIYCKAAGANIMRVGGRTDNDEIAQRTRFELRKAAKLGGPARHLEAQRLRIVARFEGLVKGVFGGDGLLDPQTLLENCVINEAQYNSFSDEEWEGNDDQPAMNAWLGDQVTDRKRQKIDDFDFDEFEESADEMELDLNVNDDQVDDEDDRIFGKWVPLSSRHTGKRPSVVNWERRCAALLGKHDNLYDIPIRDRGGVYQIMELRLREATAAGFRSVLEDAARHAQEHKAACWTRDLGIIDKNAIDIVGCTTTGLTKYRGFLAAFLPHILLIEEAAETREANVASALFPSLRQLILVGDHQQLPPSCDIARLAKQPWNLNVSLFERLVENQLPYTMLNRQRRMAPELRYIVQKFYPKLKDHPLVTKLSERPLIPGLGERRSWFFTHQWPEDTDADNSKFNQEEVEMIVAFIKYLLHNHVKASEITILTYYKGQKRKLLQRLRNKDMPIGNYFNVATVDSYQGEENEIVILSLVRSPQAGRYNNVGFLDSRNRATVAISRARRGFFMFGNKDNILGATEASFVTWAPIWNGFAEQKRVAMSKGLPLVCQNHGNEIWVKDADDLLNNAGGCFVKCDGKLSCGHPCVLNCHNVAHDKLPCLQPCPEILECGHKCDGYCSDPCRCAVNCPEYVRIQLHIQLAQAQAQVHAQATLRPSETPSPVDWLELANNPEAHDHAIRVERQRIMDDADASTITLHHALKLKDCHIETVLDKDGRRVRGRQETRDIRVDKYGRQKTAVTTGFDGASPSAQVSGDARQLVDQSSARGRPSDATPLHSDGATQARGPDGGQLGVGPVGDAETRAQRAYVQDRQANANRGEQQNIGARRHGEHQGAKSLRGTFTAPLDTKAAKAIASASRRQLEAFQAVGPFRQHVETHAYALSPAHQQQLQHENNPDSASTVGDMGFDHELEQAVQRPSVQNQVRQPEQLPRSQRIQPLISFDEDGRVPTLSETPPVAPPAAKKDEPLLDL